MQRELYTVNMSTQYFDENPDVESDPKRVSVTIGDHDYVFETDRGVFSYEKVDKATRILLDVFREKFYGTQPQTIVDVGCGYGVIACVMAHQFPDARIIGIEPNKRARGLARHNYDAHLADGRFDIFASHEEAEISDVDLVISNPPIRVGKSALYELLTQWSGSLANHGQMWLVIAKYLGADTTADFLAQSCSMKVTRVASKKGFRVLRATKAS